MKDYINRTQFTIILWNYPLMDNDFGQLQNIKLKFLMRIIIS